MPARRPTSPRHSAIVLREALTRLQRGLRDALPAQAATPAQLSVLGLLFRHGELTPGELARREGVRQQTLTRLLATLEAEGWVARVADADDGRRRPLSLTAAGRKLLAGYVHRREASLERAIASELDEDEQRLLLEACRLLDRLGAQLQAQTAEAATEGRRP